MTERGYIKNVVIGEHSWIRFDYVNWKGEASTRNVIVKKIFYGSNQWDKEEQFLMRAWDLEKNDFRDFAMKDMSNIIELA